MSEYLVLENMVDVFAADSFAVESLAEVVCWAVHAGKLMAQSG